MQFNSLLSKYTDGLFFLMIAVGLFIGFVKALIISKYIIALCLLPLSLLLLIAVQYIFVTIVLEETKIIAKRPLLFWNVMPRKKYRIISADLNEIAYVRFSNSYKGEFVLAIIDKSDKFLYRIEASSSYYFILREEFEKRNILIKNFWDGDRGLSADTQKWKENKSQNYRS